MTNKKIIYAGPLPYQGQVGGVVNLFLDLVTEVSHSEKTFDTNAKNYLSPASMVCSFFIMCTGAALKKREIALHGTAKDFFVLGSLLLIFNKLCGLKYHTRKFAGDFDIRFRRLPRPFQWVVSSFLKNSEGNFFETQALVSFFKTINPKTFWFPNYRPSSDAITSEVFNGKFLFVGQVSIEKGLQDIFSLSPLLPDTFAVDVYGPLIDISEDEFGGKIRYRGVVDKDQVCDLMSQYCALILPSYREGYPGVVIEAYSVSLPVIVSRLPSLEEIVDKGSGELVAVGSPVLFAEAMRRLETDYRDKRVGAQKKFSDFEKSRVLSSYFGKIRNGY